MAIEWLPIDEIKEYSGNANIHPDDQIDAIAESIRQFGISKPVLVDAENVLITGHGTRLGAIRAGLTTIPVIKKTNWSPRQISAYRLADNQLAKRSRYDFEKLSNEIDALLNQDFDLSALGFNEQELDALLKIDASILPDGIDQAAQVKAPPPKSRPNVKAKIVREIICPKCNHAFEG